MKARTFGGYNLHAKGGDFVGQIGTKKHETVWVGDPQPAPLIIPQPQTTPASPERELVPVGVPQHQPQKQNQG